MELSGLAFYLVGFLIAGASYLVLCRSKLTAERKVPA